MPVLRVIAGRNALDVVEGLGHEAVRIDHALEVVVVRRVGGLAVERHIQTEAPVAAVAAQVLAQRAVDAVAVHPLVMALQQRAGARHLGSCGVQLVDFHVAIVAQRIIGIEGVLQRQRVARLPLGHRTQPLHPLGKHAVSAVVVLVAQPLQHVQLAGGGLVQRRAPVRAMGPRALVFIGQCVRQTAAQVRQQRRQHLAAVLTGVVGHFAATFVVHVDAPVVIALTVAVTGNPPVQAEGGLALVAAAQAHLHLAAVTALGRLGDVVDGATHAASPVQEARRSRDILHPLVDPAVHRLGGDGVLQVDAVVGLVDRCAVEAPLPDLRVARRGAGAHARHAVQDLVRVAGAASLDGRPVHDRDRSRGLTLRQAQAAAGLVGNVHVQSAIGAFLTIPYRHGRQLRIPPGAGCRGGVGRLSGSVVGIDRLRMGSRCHQHAQRARKRQQQAGQPGRCREGRMGRGCLWSACMAAVMRRFHGEGFVEGKGAHTGPSAAATHHPAQGNTTRWLDGKGSGRNHSLRRNEGLRALPVRARILKKARECRFAFDQEPCRYWDNVSGRRMAAERAGSHSLSFLALAV